MTERMSTTQHSPTQVGLPRNWEGQKDDEQEMFLHCSFWEAWYVLWGTSVGMAVFCFGMFWFEFLPVGQGFYELCDPTFFGKEMDLRFAEMCVAGQVGKGPLVIHIEVKESSCHDCF